jgi:hypothetical protein
MNGTTDYVTIAYASSTTPQAVAATYSYNTYLCGHRIGAVAGPKGPAGPPGEVYEQPAEPASTSIGAIWIDTDDPLPAVSAPARVTSLPLNPLDTQECYLVADAANGILWHFRYNAGSSSPYKWEFVGGSDMYAEVAALEGAGTAFAALATPGPSLTAPVAGDYAVRIQTRVGLDSPNAAALMSYTVGATAASLVDAARGISPNIRNDQGDGGSGAGTYPGPAVASSEGRKTVAANTAFVAQYRREGNVSAAYFSNRRMWIRPVRVG